MALVVLEVLEGFVGGGAGEGFVGEFGVVGGGGGRRRLLVVVDLVVGFFGVVWYVVNGWLVGD